MDREGIRDRRMGAVLVASAGALWGTIGVAAKGAFRFDISPVDAALWRAGGAFLILLLAALAANRRVLLVQARDLPMFAAYGLIGVALFMTVYFYAIRLATVATAAMLLYTAPAWVTLLARVFFHEALTTRKLAAVLLTFAGSALAVRAYDPAALRVNVAGVSTGLAAGLTYALYSIFGKRARRAAS